MGWIRRFAPRASVPSRLLTATVMWSAIGAGLLLAGVRWILAASSLAWLAALPAAIAVGWLKGRYLLAPRAETNLQRIVDAGDGRCLGGAFSWSSWGFALVMMAVGMLLRRSALPRPWLGVLYSAVGSALATASVPGWRRWRRSLKQPHSSP